jgi:cell wall-associated NlpC family hydrolase
MVDCQSLVGRRWEYGESDCYTLMRDFYGLLGIKLPQYVRPADLETCNSIFLDQMPKQGFGEVPFSRRLPHDVLLMRLGTKTPMHAAILLPNERILHQKQDSLSCIETLNAYYCKKTEHVFRYAAGAPAR